MGNEIVFVCLIGFIVVVIAAALVTKAIVKVLTGRDVTLFDAVVIDIIAAIIATFIGFLLKSMA